jgi:hypothetical protein
VPGTRIGKRKRAAFLTGFVDLQETANEIGEYFQEAESGVSQARRRVTMNLGNDKNLREKASRV